MREVSLTILCILFALVHTNVQGQIDIDHIEKVYGQGEVILNREISLSFEYDNIEGRYVAKASHRIQKTNALM